MNESPNNLLITVTSGVLVFVLGQIFMEFILRPIQEYKKLKAKVAKSLILYANYYSHPRDPMDHNNIEPWTNGADALRELASEVAAFAEIKPPHIFVLFLIPSKKKLLDASRNLIGLSNSFFTPAEVQTIHMDHIRGYSNAVKKQMHISK